jgi:GTP diphosphokinase / guanosine-3',5'-bis(diphosphate) 3'-diphosphatase
VPVLDESAGLLIQAIKFSSFRHRTQRRKDASGSAYIHHPIQVMELIWDVGEIRDRDILIAALLHDTIEDTVRPTSLEEVNLKQEIADLFGKEVLAMVLEVTDDKKKDDKVRKQLQIDHAPALSFGAKIIRLADKTANLQDIIDNPPVFWSRARKSEYFDWAEKVVAGLRGVNPNLEKRFDQVVQAGRAVLI